MCESTERQPLSAKTHTSLYESSAKLRPGFFFFKCKLPVHYDGYKGGKILVTYCPVEDRGVVGSSENGAPYHLKNPPGI